MTEATAPATEALVDEATMQELIKLNEQRAAIVHIKLIQIGRAHV